MNPLRGWFSAVRTWLALGDPTDDRLTPSHGWVPLIPAPVAAVRKTAAPVPTARPPR